jgi:hypothetical protein
MTASEIVSVVIYDAPTGGAGGCGCGCGGHSHGPQQGHDYGHDHGHHHHGEIDPLTTANMEMLTRALALTLEAAFPGRVKVEYINVLKDPRGPRLPQTALLCSLAYPTPLVYINGQGRFAGALPVERIREEVGKILGGS